MPGEELDARTWSGLEYLEAVSGPGAIAEMVQSYVQDVPGRIWRMKEALEAGDRPLLGRLAHDLKSNSATLGALRLSAMAAQVEHSAASAEAGDLEATIREVEELLPEVLAALEERVRRYPG